MKDQLLRTAAELDNYRKRTEREIAMIIQNANKELIINLLPVVDDLERSLKISQKETTAEDLHKGVELIYQKVMSLLQNQGLKPMESIGMPFDVDVHDALMQIEKKGADSNIIIEEHGKGYFLNDQVLRHAKVVVSK